MTCFYAHDDGAYVLGALAPAERAAYERHLADCAACRQAVTEIAVLPGLLGRLDADAAAQVHQDAGPAAESRVTSLLAAATSTRRRERKTRQWRFAGAALAAACLALVVGLGAGMLRGGDGPAGGPLDRPAIEMVSMAKVPPERVPVTAEIGLTKTGWGTSITMHCAYPTAGADYEGGASFKLVAYNKDGVREELGSWNAGPGDEITLTAATRFTETQLDRVELVQVGRTDRTLLVRDV